jgi:PPOX class probable F420-dependent enzyme
MSQMTEPVIQLLKGKNFASLVALMSDGSPHVTPTWIDLDEDSGSILIPTVEGRIKHKNVSIDPRVAICISDENNPYNMVLIRGKVIKMTKEGAVEHTCKICR